MHVANLVSVWTVLYDKPSRYNWLFQYYLRAQGLVLSWVGTGRLILSHNYSDTDFRTVADRFVRGCGSDGRRRLVVDGAGRRQPSGTPHDSGRAGRGAARAAAQRRGGHPAGLRRFSSLSASSAATVGAALPWTWLMGSMSSPRSKCIGDL